MKFRICLCITCLIFSISTLPLWAQDSTAADSLLIRQLEEEMEQPQDNPAASAQTSTTINPNISAIGDFRALYSDEGDRNWDAFVHGAEFAFRAVVDPYVRADFYPVFEGEGGDLNAKVEEAYLTTLSLPLGLQLKAGKFRQAFGRANLVHRHALPVIDVPVAYETFMGEAMIDQGFSLSWLIPNPSFYQELIVDITRGPDESPLFSYSTGNRVMTMAKLKNFWSLNENSTLEIGFSGASGENEFGLSSRLGGIDITYIWKPLRRNTYRSFEWQSEFYFSDVELPADQNENAWGMYSWVQYQVAQRWFLTGMYSYAQQPLDSSSEEQAISANVGWYATEFQKLELGPQLISETGFQESAFSMRFRWVFVIGAHGAHQY